MSAGPARVIVCGARPTRADAAKRGFDPHAAAFISLMKQGRVMNAPYRLGAVEPAVGAGVAELVDALDLGSSDANRGGSTPPARTMCHPEHRHKLRVLLTCK